MIAKQSDIENNLQALLNTARAFLPNGPALPPGPPGSRAAHVKTSCLMQTNQEETLFPCRAGAQPLGPRRRLVKYRKAQGLQGSVTPIRTATNTAGKAINTGMQPGAIAIGRS